MNSKNFDQSFEDEINEVYQELSHNDYMSDEYEMVTCT